MSRRGNCHDNTVAESFFQLLKRERIKKRIYATRTEARSDIFEYIEMFYNSKRRHGSNGQRSPLDYEKANQNGYVCLEFWWLFILCENLELCFRYSSAK
jgi:putative transposase